MTLSLTQILAIFSGIVTVLCSVITLLWKERRDEVIRLRTENERLSQMWKDEVVSHSIDAKRFVIALENLQSRSSPWSGKMTKS